MDIFLSVMQEEEGRAETRVEKPKKIFEEV